MRKIKTNSPGNTCDNPISSNCVIYDGPDIPFLNLCKGMSISSVMNDLAQEFLTVLNTLNELINGSGTSTVTGDKIDLSALNLGCLYNPTTQVWSCPGVGETFFADSSAMAVNGTAGFCQILRNGVPELTKSVPTLTTITNPPITKNLTTVLQLIIDRICACDPCNLN